MTPVGLHPLPLFLETNHVTIKRSYFVLGSRIRRSSGRISSRSCSVSIVSAAIAWSSSEISLGSATLRSSVLLTEPEN